MKYVMKTILVFGAMALAGPASAQMVNGLSGPDYNHEAPIGTKSGGSKGSLQAPGEAAAIAGALRNEMEAKNMQPGSGNATVVIPRQRITARNDTAKDRLDNDEE
jgi:hypothetical protein